MSYQADGPRENATIQGIDVECENLRVRLSKAGDNRAELESVRVDAIALLASIHETKRDINNQLRASSLPGDEKDYAWTKAAKRVRDILIDRESPVRAVIGGANVRIKELNRAARVPSFEKAARRILPAKWIAKIEEAMNEPAA